LEKLWIARIAEHKKKVQEKIDRGEVKVIIEYFWHDGHVCDAFSFLFLFLFLFFFLFLSFFFFFFFFFFFSSSSSSSS
jgi:hypothetical protein